MTSSIGTSTASPSPVIDRLYNAAITGCVTIVAAILSTR
jgi:hypothetical protein